MTRRTSEKPPRPSTAPTLYVAKNVAEDGVKQVSIPVSRPIVIWGGIEKAILMLRVDPSHFDQFVRTLKMLIFKEKSRKAQIGPLESLGHRESGTAIPSSGDSSQPSNEPFEGGHSTPFSRHFLNKNFLWTSFLDPNFLVLSLSPWGGRKLWPPFTATFETR